MATTYAEDKTSGTSTDNRVPGYHKTDGSTAKAGAEIRDSAATDRRIDANAKLDTNASGAMEKITKGSDLMGTKVKNSKGETLGSISDIALDLSSGKINYVVLSSGGILGFRDRLYALPVNALRHSTEEKTFILDVDKEALQATPGFIKNNWPDRADESLMQRINRNANRNTEIIKEPAGAKVKVEADDSKLKVEKDGETKFKAERKN